MFIFFSKIQNPDVQRDKDRQICSTDGFPGSIFGIKSPIQVSGFPAASGFRRQEEAAKKKDVEAAEQSHGSLQREFLWPELGLYGVSVELQNFWCSISYILYIVWFKSNSNMFFVILVYSDWPAGWSVWMLLNALKRWMKSQYQQSLINVWTFYSSGGVSVVI